MSYQKERVLSKGDDLRGYKIGHYRLMDIVGKGGIGVVYRAKHIELDLPFAVKFLQPNYRDDPELIERFRREVKVSIFIKHPNTVQIIDFGQDPRVGYYYVMEYLEGQSLSEWMKKHPDGAPAEEVLHFMEQICSVLETAHQKKIVHRDLKPSNIFLINGENQPLFVKVLDFGAAKLLGNEQAGITIDGQIVGSPRFMSPEQIRGDIRAIDHRSDIYSLGLILFILLTGKYPFKGSQVHQLLQQHLFEPPPPLGKVCPSRYFPPELEKLVASMLAKKPEDRPSSAGEVFQRLKKILSRVPNSFDPPSSQSSSSSEERRDSVELRSSEDSSPGGGGDFSVGGELELDASQGGERGHPAVLRRNSRGGNAEGDKAKNLFAGYILEKPLSRDPLVETYLAVKRGVLENKFILKKVSNRIRKYPDLFEQLLRNLTRYRQVSHPGIATLYEFNSYEGSFYLVREYIFGKNLREFGEHLESLPPEVTLYLALQILDTLSYTHGATGDSGELEPLVHGFLRPDKIYLTPSGAVKIVDFGLGTIRLALDALSRGKTPLPKPTPQLDLYAVGRLLLSGLAGVDFSSPGPLPSPRQVIPDINPQLAEILERSLGISGAPPFRSAREFYRELSNYLNSLAIEQSELKSAIQELFSDISGSFTQNRTLSRYLLQSQLPTVYLFGQDRVFDEQLKRDLLDPHLGGKFYRFVILDSAEEIRSVYRQLTRFKVPPFAVIFGGLHVAMQLDFLAEMASYPEVMKILVMKRPNAEILSMAVNLCGLNHFLEPPVTWKELVQALRRWNSASQICKRITSLQERLRNMQASESQLRSQADALATANIRAIELIAEIELKNKIIEEKNRFLERIAKTVMQSHKTAESRRKEEVFFKGDLQALGIVDLLRLMSLSRKTAMITLLDKNENKAQIAFEDGEIKDAKYRELRGEEAVRELLTWREGKFSVHAIPEEVERTIFRSTENLLLDLLREQDEKNYRSKRELKSGERDGKE